MCAFRRSLVITSVCVLLASAYAQVPNLEPKFPLDKPVATVSFEVAFPGVQAEHYVFSVESSGSAAYHSDNIGEEGRRQSAAGEPYILKFTVSEATCMRIFQLARQADYFKGEFSSIKGPVVNASITTLTYSEGPAFSSGYLTNVVRNTTTYSYTANPVILQIARIFEGISNTLELGRRLDYLRAFAPSSLDAALERAEYSSCSHQLLELETIQQSLKDVAEDPSATNTARQRARQLLSLAQSSQQPASTSNLNWCRPPADNPGA